MQFDVSKIFGNFGQQESVPPVDLNTSNKAEESKPGFDPKIAAGTYGVYTAAKLAALPVAIMIWQGIDVDDMPDPVNDNCNAQTRAVRSVKMKTYRAFCTEDNGRNGEPCKYLFGDDIFTKEG